MRRHPKVKTDPDVPKLPFTCLLQGKYWYFRCGQISVPIHEENGTEAFYQRWHELYLRHAMDAPDERLVYFIGWRDGPVKIGMADKINGRLAQLQTACPYDLHVWASTAGGMMRERELHRQFAKHRMRGEWFARVPEIEAEIARLSQEAPCLSE